MTIQRPNGPMNGGGMQPVASTVAPLPANEIARISALQDLHILDSGHDERFDRIARLVKVHFGMPVVRISFVDTDRTWFKACIGLNARQAPRAISICAHTILKEDVLVCHDLTTHPIFRLSPQVVGPPGFRFYAGAPIELVNGFKVGSICLMDYDPRDEFDDRDEDILKDFASIVVDELELHRQIAEDREALASAKNVAASATAANAEVFDFLSSDVNKPLSDIHDNSSRLIECLEFDRPDCAELAKGIKDTAARLASEARRLASINASSGA
ncbi:MAG: GAF domain-containing protein [Alphaproteobacteria bacterium]